MSSEQTDRRRWDVCPLCHADAVRDFVVARGRPYGECGECALIHLSPEHRLDPQAERAEYETHDNRPDDPGYRAFLGRVADPLATRLPPGAEGLDYGSGPGPTLSVMLEEQGFPMTIYDPIFAPDPGVLERIYDFVTCTETVEHFFDPGDEFDRINGMLRPGGWLAVMTQVYSGDPPFESWRYPRERSHVCFYRQETMHWLARHYGWTIESPGPNVFLFRRGGPDGHYGPAP